MGSGGDATPCEVIGEELGPLTYSLALRTVAVCLLNVSLRNVQQDCGDFGVTGPIREGHGNSANRMRCLNWEATTTVGCPAQNGYCARSVREVAL